MSEFWNDFKAKQNKKSDIAKAATALKDNSKPVNMKSLYGKKK